jgi:hypothetical protein
MKKHPKHVSKLAICAVVAASLSGSLFASSSPSPSPAPVQNPHPPQRNAELNIRAPHHPVNLIQEVVIGRIVDRIHQLGLLGATAGVATTDSKKQVTPASNENQWFRNPSFYTEYSYLNSNDDRVLGTDSITNSGAIGFDFVTISDILAGVSYQYSHQDAFTGTTRDFTGSDSNFFNVYAAKSFYKFLTVGVTGGYGHTESKATVRNTGVSTRSNTDTANVSPFVSLAYAKGNFYTSLTTSYQYAHNEVDDSGKVTVRLLGGYNVAEWLTAEASGKYSVIVHDNQRGNTDPNQWYGVGAKLKQPISTKLSVYESYNYDVNSAYQEHSATVGLNYSF